MNFSRKLRGKTFSYADLCFRNNKEREAHILEGCLEADVRKWYPPLESS